MVVVLLDTNVWVSALLNPHGPPARLKEAWLAGQFAVVVSIPLLEEIADVLGSAQYAVSRDDDLKGDADLVAQMRSRGIEVLTVRRFLERLATSA